MVSDKATGDEWWLRLVCLTVSVGLHVSLIAASWQSPEWPMVDRRPLTVVLIERPAATPAPPGETALPGRQLGVPAPSRRQAPTAAVSQAPPVAAEADVVVPEQTTAEDPAERAAGDASDGLQSGSRVQTHDGDNRTKDFEGRTADKDGGLIKATPRYESNPVPHYPQLARQNRWEGTVRLRVMVTASGVVEAVTLERSSGHEVLDRSALDGVQHWRFIPATRGGLPVPCEISIPVAFRLTEP